MTGFQLVASLVQSLAWPVFGLLIATVLRRPIARMLLGRPPLKMKAGPFEVEWDRVLAETETEVQAAPAPATAQLSGTRPSEELAAEASAAPAVAVLEAHAIVERALRKLVADLPEAEKRTSAVGLARLAQQKGLIGEQTVRAVQGVSVLRNLAAHGSARDITPAQAQQYLALVDAVLFALPAE
jgi:hypothetical protein